MPDPLTLPPLEAIAEPGRTVEELQAYADALEEHAEHTRKHLHKLVAGPTTRDRVRELALQGLDDATIGRRLGLRRDYVVRLRTLEGIRAARPRAEPRTNWQEITAAMMAEGRTPQEIAEATKVSVRTVHNRMSKLRKDAGGSRKRKAG